MTNKISTALLLTLLGAWLMPAAAQYSGAHGNRGYASDSFEGFDEVDRTKMPQKKGSWWYWLSADTAAAQLAHCIQRERDGRLNSARKGYEALVREWPATVEAAQAQLNLANVLEKMKKYEKAFDEYQYALVHYSGHCPYDEIIDRQYRIANLLLHENKSMFGWLLSGTADIRERFELIIRNAPRSPIAPEAMLKVGRIREDGNQMEEAIKVYDGILNRYPASPQAETAAWLAARCRYQLSVKHRYNENRCRESVAFLKAALERLPKHPKRAELEQWLAELNELLVEQNYQKALFYDTPRYNNATKISSYRRFLAEFSDSKHANAARERIAALGGAEAGTK
jgi:outer membrane protein assembly factor BamD (BamD/ComL family)